MITRALNVLDNIRASFWFVPALMSVGAIILAFVLTGLDTSHDGSWLRNVGWLYANKPEGARVVLSTVASSMITVAGVTFSMTTLAVSFASGNIGPRVLSNFMRDRGNHFTLGTFIATFLYCIFVLRTIRAKNEVAGEAYDAFVPQTAILGALVLTVASVAVLIYFIHHVPDSIQMSNVVAKIGRSLESKLGTLFPATIGHPAEDLDNAHPAPGRGLPDDFFEDALPVCSEVTGYIQTLHEDGLLATAEEHDLIVYLRHQPGDFVRPGTILLLAGPSARVDEKVAALLAGGFACNSERSPAQDALFLVDQLIEILGRALSPGINDPFTAMNCMDWLEGALSLLAGRQPPSRFRYGSDEKLRVVSDPLTFCAFADEVFNRSRAYVAPDRNAALHQMRMAAHVATDCEDEADRAHLLLLAAHLQAAAASHLDPPAIAELDRYYSALERLHRDPRYRQRLRTGQVALEATGDPER